LDSMSSRGLVRAAVCPLPLGFMQVVEAPTDAVPLRGRHDGVPPVQPGK
jgi:hypothetical protein